MVLLAGCVGARPVVLAPLALRATGTLNAGRGARARRARRRVLRLCLAELLLLPGLCACEDRDGLVCGSGLLLVRVMREGARAAPAPAGQSQHVGGLSRRLRLFGHDSNQQQALVFGLEATSA